MIAPTSSPSGNDELPNESLMRDIEEALGQQHYLSYAPPNIYPMSAPAFQEDAAIRPPHTGGPLGLYVHIPFCKYACSFCFYAKSIGDNRETMVRYVEALERELEWVPSGTPLTQVFVGGGTPTALPPDLLDRSLTAVFRNVGTSALTHTVECSPDTLTDEHIAVIRGHGVGRVSMGIQSTHDETLELIRRKHAGNVALDTCGKLVASGLMVNIDLIYGLPGQTMEHFRRDFELVAASGVHSVTAYNLRVNEKTPVVRKLGAEERLDTLSGLMQWRAFVKSVALQAGYRQTRCHTYVRSDRDDAGSRVAARFKDMTGRGDQFSAGMSARSRLGDRVYRNDRVMRSYVESIENGSSPVKETFQLDEMGRKIRHLALTFGEGEGLNLAEYETLFGNPFEQDFGVPLTRTSQAGLVEGEYTIRLTDSGRLLYDRVMMAFYPENVKSWLRERESIGLAAKTN